MSEIINNIEKGK